MREREKGREGETEGGRERVGSSVTTSSGLGRLRALLIRCVHHQVHLVFYGDETRSVGTERAEEAFEKNYAFKYNALALGKTGDTSLNLLWRLEDGELGSKHAGFTPDVAVLLIGVHDFLTYVHPEVLDGR